MTSVDINPGTAEITEALRPVLKAKAVATTEQQSVFDIDMFRSYVIPIVVTTTSSYLLQRLIDNWIDDGNASDQKEMFTEMQRIVKESDLPSREQLDIQEYERRLEPARKSMHEMRELIVKSIDQIDEAQKSLESAQDKTQCTLCRTTLSKLSEELKLGKSGIESGTRYILTAADKWDAIQKLKSAGKISKDTGWDKLTESERNLVRRMAKHET